MFPEAGIENLRGVLRSAVLRVEAESLQDVFEGESLFFPEQTDRREAGIYKGDVFAIRLIGGLEVGVQVGIPQEGFFCEAEVPFPGGVVNGFGRIRHRLECPENLPGHLLVGGGLESVRRSLKLVGRSLEPISRSLELVGRSLEPISRSLKLGEPPT
ncbi:hypothetical protein [Fimbriiglobus ruber]|uniref:hypothetical protein n=1 Tax=Fimbriiglobus ruber TaxID=1908690 RepID=UPI00137B12E8|nr:hypothetical protein [Fimbriiglobus ruber]